MSAQQWTPDQVTKMDLAREAIAAKRWPWIDAVGQPWGKRWSEEDLLSFVKVAYMIQVGAITLTQVDVGDVAMQDRERERNARVLAGAPAPFVFDVDQDQNASPSVTGTPAGPSPST